MRKTRVSQRRKQQRKLESTRARRARDIEVNQAFGRIKALLAAPCGMHDRRSRMREAIQIADRVEMQPKMRKELGIERLDRHKSAGALVVLAVLAGR